MSASFTIQEDTWTVNYKLVHTRPPSQAEDKWNYKLLRQVRMEKNKMQEKRLKRENSPQQS